MINAGRASRVTESEAVPKVTDLLQRLVTQIENKSLSSENTITRPNGEEIILNLQMDGIRYTLTRSSLRSSPSEIVNLSPREKEVARLVAKGLSNRAIASALDISPWTVSTHLRRVFNKLDVGSRAEMVACVLKKGILRSLE